MKSTVIIAAAIAAACALPAAAQEAAGNGMTIFGRNLNVSLKAKVGPDYRGSDDYSVRPSGSVSLSLPGSARTYGAPDDGISIALVGNDTIAAGLLGEFEGGRHNDDDLRGFDEIDWAFEGGAFVNLWASDSLRLRVEARRGFGGHEGVVVDLGADAFAREGRWTASIGPRLRWTDDEYTQTYFGVTPRDAARSPYALLPYNADGGLAHAGALASVIYQWSPSWSVTADAEYRKILGDAADSPIVARLGSEDQFLGSVGVRYAFGR